ncbi:MAG: tyrosine-type recombinase/integrase [Bacteroidetes bacterium]|nr:tyrosine-type recombinase/integrase [Bacteroidota bacterium]
MGANIKIIRYKSKEKKGGKAPLAIRITKNGERSYIFLKNFISEDQWDEESSTVKKNYPNSRRLNILLNNKFSDAEQVILDAENKDQDLSASQLKDLILGGGFAFVSFNKLAKEYLDGKLSSGKINQHVADKPKFKKFRMFLEKKGLGISVTEKDQTEKQQPNNKKKEEEIKRDINVKLITGTILKDYDLYLKSLGKSKTTIYNHLNVVRIVYNKAIEKRLIDEKDYPFGKGKTQVQFKPGESMKIGLDENELETLESIKIDENNIDVVTELKRGKKYVKDIPKRLKDLSHARNIFLFSFNFAGLRTADTFKTKWSDFKNGRYYYVIGKNSKPVDVPIPPQVEQILESYLLYKKSDDDYVFPELKKAKANPKDIHTKIRTANKKVNEDLSILVAAAKIEKDISLHISRHTFGNISKGNIPPEVLQDLYRHSNLSTTINYQKNFIKRKMLDEGLMKIVNFRRQKDENTLAVKAED